MIDEQTVEVRIVFYDFAGAMPIVAVGPNTVATVSKTGLDVRDVVRVRGLKGFILETVTP